MFKKMGNRALLRLRITTKTPLSIRAGDTGLDPAGSDLKCIRTYDGVGERSVFIPGSSLKGVIRSSIESQLRNQHFVGGIEGACDPLDHLDNCGHKNEKKEGASVHKNHCLTCRLFGSTAMKGRVAIRDFMPWEVTTNASGEHDEVAREQANRTMVRHGIAINRVSGGVGRGKLFDQEMVPPGATFWGEIALDNYQVWQLGLLASAFQELNDGFAQLGSSKSSGLGVVDIDVNALVHEQVAQIGEKPLGEKPLGVGHIFTSTEDYGLLPEVELPVSPSEQRGLLRRFKLNEEESRKWLEAGLNGLCSLRG